MIGPTFSILPFSIFLIITDCVALGICGDKTLNMFALEVTVSLFHGLIDAQP
jgi:hypothetical protein